MTDQNPNDSSPPNGDPFAAEGDGTSNAKGSEWLSQLQTMINDITTQAAPVARQVAAKAAELTAVAAVKAGPLAQRAAEVTTDAGQKLAERAQSLAAKLRAADSGDAAAGEAAGSDAGAGASGAEATFEDATDSTTDGAPTTSFEGGGTGDDQQSQTPGI
jgi:hypothetical protein